MAHPVDGFDGGFARKPEYEQFVCTVTDRAAMAWQAQVLEVAPTVISSKRRILALHQDYENTGLWEFARGLGYEVFRSPRYEDFLDLYRGADIHLGNRLHAHLKCLSYGVRSFLTPFDLRQQFFAESLDFPLVTALPNPALDTYDFRRATARIEAAKPQMNMFVNAVTSALAERRTFAATHGLA